MLSNRAFQIGVVWAASIAAALWLAARTPDKDKTFYSCYDQALSVTTIDAATNSQWPNKSLTDVDKWRALLDANIDQCMDAHSYAHDSSYFESRRAGHYYPKWD